MKSELAQRVVSGVILAIAVLFITWWHPTSFATLCGLGAWILWKEWRALTRTRGAWFTIGGALYIAAAIASLIALRREEDGFYIILLLFAVVWSGDIGGYVFGKLMGRHKIAPAISPGKSWEGLAGSILTTAAVLYSITLATGAHNPWWSYLMVAAAVSSIGLGGDMFESALKRRAGVKDSGRLIPGHGGLFDRVDALLPVSILFGAIYFLLPLVAGA